MSKNLTTRQQEVYDFLRETSRATGLIPSTREIQHHFGFASQTAAMSHLRAIEKKGVIQRLPGKARAVIFPEELDREEIRDIPLYGNIAAGFAEASVEDREGCVSIDVNSLGGRGNKETFALKVRGESMIDAHICHGDTVILERREPANREIVAALIDGETTLKRFISQNGKTYLQAENAAFPDLIPSKEMLVQGVMIALLRNVA